MREAIRAFIEGELLAGHPVRDDENLLVAGPIDSLGVMRLVAFLEERLGRRIPATDVTLRNFATLDAIAAYAEGRAAG